LQRDKSLIVRPDIVADFRTNALNSSTREYLTAILDSLSVNFEIFLVLEIETRRRKISGREKILAMEKVLHGN